MMQTPIRWAALNLLPAGRMVRHLSAFCFAIVLLCSLIVGQSASAFPAPDHHATSSTASSGTPWAEPAAVVLSCHPALACATFVIPSGATGAFVSGYAVVLLPEFAQTRPRFGGPSVSLPPPRLLT